MRGHRDRGRQPASSPRRTRPTPWNTVTPTVRATHRSAPGWVRPSSPAEAAAAHTQPRRSGDRLADTRDHVRPHGVPGWPLSPRPRPERAVSASGVEDACIPGVVSSETVSDAVGAVAESVITAGFPSSVHSTRWGRSLHLRGGGRATLSSARVASRRRRASRWRPVCRCGFGGGGSAGQHPWTHHAHVVASEGASGCGSLVSAATDAAISWMDARV